MRALAFVWLCLACLAAPARAESVTVFAAASLATALDAAAADYRARTGVAVTASYAGSPALARQIRYGAPAEVVILASTDWMDVLAAEGLLAPGTRRDLLGNSLVLVARPPAEDMGEIGPGTDIAGVLGPGRLAIALTEAVPAGIYGKAALNVLGLWPDLADRLAETDNVRAALALVATGAAPLGIVYATDARAEPRVVVVGRFPEASHPPITYPAAMVAGAGPAARAFLDFLVSPEGRAPFVAQGFLIPEAR